ncbi:methylated-DNA--[protein]-cysteine S-methyltransferase [Umboniibacter marinipuniceus]|uniref:methylated-DNA--[protein]-cysteine S-methyltransferase n=1 Tax=Umboniibacter marinipuniceus TaxID=569599 RepID=A0A3M0A2Y0_9GAMM|nr:MGMT family protein [Umboniibacter marinipuniceus]RMA78804.1 O-6-methylguanine DNA methyltransferase [Umboniibacter marinipuniceus]
MQSIELPHGGLINFEERPAKRAQLAHFSFRLPMAMVHVSHAEDVVVSIELSAIGAPASSLTPQQRRIARSIEELWRGKPQNLILQGPLTEFSMAVWQALVELSPGSTISYTTLAERAGNPRAARAVARVMSQNTQALVLPCHRVIGKSGALTGYRWGEDIKAALIEFEKLQLS